MENTDVKKQQKFVMEITKNEFCSREKLFKEISKQIENFLFANDIKETSSFKLLFETNKIEYAGITDIKKHKSIWDEG